MRLKSAGMLIVLSLTATQMVWGHVTLKPSGPLQPGGYAVVALTVPNERHVDTTGVTLEVPDAFLQAGGRISRVEYPAGWQVKIEKEDKPGAVYQQDMEARAKRRAEVEQAAGSGRSEEEQMILDELQKKWIKRVTFEGGSIPPDGFRTFMVNFELPEEPGEFRFSAVQIYADGSNVSWSQIVEGAERPAPTLSVRNGQRFDWTLLVAAAALVLALVSLLTRVKRAPAK